MNFARLAATSLGVILAMAIVAASSLQLTQTSLAQATTEPAITDAAVGSLTPEQIEADRIIWKKADCSSCHGWSGNGHDTGPIAPGPSLRDTQLAFVDIREVVQCGRPATNMPSHDRLAYTDTRCYNMKSVDIGHDKPLKGTPLKPAELDAISAYVAGYLKGRGPTTKAECEDYWGAGNASCSAYE